MEMKDKTVKGDLSLDPQEVLYRKYKIIDNKRH